MSRDPAAILLDIRKAGRSAIGFVRGMSWETFLGDPRTQKAVIYDIQTVGEAIKRLSREFCRQHAEIPWSQVTGMRDKLVHDYDQINLEMVWKVVNDDLPQLLGKIDRLIPQPEE
jgi:uncharacterized protein with HEPN domain